MSFAFKIVMAGASPIILILAGGSGTRFWPLSRKDRPKQYLAFYDEHSLIQHTVSRVAPLVKPERIFICSNESQKPLLNEQLPQIENLIFEPLARNTAPCLALSVIHCLRLGIDPKTPMAVLPADHFIARESAFRALLVESFTFAQASQGLITLGIVPTSPHTGYGYIEAGGKVEGASCLKVKSFVEKPSLERAQKFLSAGNYFWNAGIFVWTLEAIASAFRQLLPDLWKAMESATTPQSLAAAYESLPSLPVDVGIMEKASNRYVFPAEIGWSDVGSWDAVYQLKSPEGKGNALLSGNAKALESEGCLVHVPPHKEVALLGVNDLIVVDDGDRLLVANRSHDQKVREIAGLFEPSPAK